MFPVRSIVRTLGTLAVCLVAVGHGVGGAQDAAGPAAEPPARCEITGVVSGLRLRARTPRRRTLTLDGLLAVVAPIRHGLTAVRATLDDGTTVEGTTRNEVPYEVRERAVLSGGALTAHPGAAILDVVPIDGTATADLDLILADGVIARSVPCPCAALRPVGGAAAGPTTPPSPLDHAAPRWRPRVRDLHLRSGEAADTGEDLHLDITDATLRLVETERHRGWVRVAATLRGGEVVGWTRDTDLAPAPRDRRD